MIKNKKGFTLIELIIVMAIVGILAVVAVVAISSKAGDARDARRRSDLSSIQLAFALHTSDGYGNDDVATDATPWSVEPFPNVHEGNNPGTYMNVANVKDPSRTGSCQWNHANTLVEPTCNNSINPDTNGGYTFLELAGGVDTDVGTFANYNIGVTLEAGYGHWLYVTQLGISEVHP